MMQMSNIADPNTYKLLTPGPLTTTLAVREAMLVDRCTWDDDYKGHDRIHSRFALGTGPS